MGVTRYRAAVALVAALLVAACSAGPPTTSRAGPSTSADPAAARSVPLRDGERFQDVTMPSPYTPEAPTYGTDDYRCFLLDPGLEDRAFVTGVDVVPGSPDVVHHVILFRVPPAQVSEAEAVDAATEGQGWTCFGGSGLGALAGDLGDAPWLGAWAPGGGERVMAPDIGIPMAPGSRIVMQVHYNLLAGDAPDVSSARIRWADGDKDLVPLRTMLLPAPVELPCRPGRTGELCDREAAIADVVGRFGQASGQQVAGLQLLCGVGTFRPGPTQSCTRPVLERVEVRAVGGHMHLLGRSVTVVANPGRRDERTLLDVPVWNFDDQGTVALRKPARLGPGDSLEVTCTHDQRLRDLVPELQDLPERYVVWGEGTTDEMCLGVVLVTRP